MMSALYFAYGSAMDREGRIRSRGYYNDFIPLGTARLERYSFKMNKLADSGTYVYANIEKNDTDNVYGMLCEVTQRAVKYLDGREGFYGDSDPANHYDRKHVTVSIGETEYQNVLVYIANPRRTVNGIYPTTQSYAQELKSVSHLLPEDYRLRFLSEVEKCI